MKRIGKKIEKKIKLNLQKLLYFYPWFKYVANNI